MAVYHFALRFPICLCGSLKTDMKNYVSIFSFPSLRPFGDISSSFSALHSQCQMPKNPALFCVRLTAISKSEFWIHVTVVVVALGPDDGRCGSKPGLLKRDRPRVYHSGTHSEADRSA